jgi:hypothetical protein
MYTWNFQRYYVVHVIKYNDVYMSRLFDNFALRRQRLRAKL